MPLTDVKVRNLKPKEKPYKGADGDGLYVLVNPNGGKLWRLKYRWLGKEKLLALGAYPEVSLGEARERKVAARKQLAQGIDPSAAKKAQKAALITKAENSFEVVAREWFEKYKHTWGDGHAVTVIGRLERDVFPWLGKAPIDSIEAPDVLTVLRRVEARGARETAHRIRTVCGQVFRYAIATGRAKRDVAADLKGAIPPTTPKHHAAITDPVDFAGLVRAMHSYRGTFVVQCALKLACLTFVRPGELRKAEWAEFDLDCAEWNIPIERLKLKKHVKAARKGERHLVPLSSQAVQILRELQPLTGGSRFVFPNARSKDRCMSNNAVLAALRRMGYTKDEMTGHGYRAAARTILDEVLEQREELIEHQLAHAVKDPNGRAYNRTTRIAERREVMQVWGDYVERLAVGEDVSFSEAGDVIKAIGGGYV